MIFADLGIVAMPHAALFFLARGDLQATVVLALAAVIDLLLWAWGRRRGLHSIWPSKERRSRTGADSVLGTRQDRSRRDC